MRRTFDAPTKHFYDVFMRLPPKSATKLNHKPNLINNGLQISEITVEEILIKTALTLDSAEICICQSKIDPYTK